MAAPPNELSAAAEAWRRRGRMAEACGKRIFVVDEGEGSGKPPLLIVHGFPTSSYDFQHVWERLKARRRVVACDLPGFGFSEKPQDYSYSLLEQADVIEVLARKLGLEKVDLWAHDMGTSVATELLARRRNGLLGFEVGKVVLMNGSLHAEMAHLTPSQKLLLRPRLGPVFAKMARLATYRWQLKKILAKPVAEEELNDQFHLMRLEEGHSRLPRIILYYHERIRFRERWIGALQALDRPCLVLWGTEDPVAVMAIAEKVAKETPGAKLVRLEGIGHYPQLEAPDLVAEQLERFLAAT